VGLDARCYSLTSPIPITAVGLRHVKPTLRHADAMLSLNAMLASLQIMPPNPRGSKWSHNGPKTPFENVGGDTVDPNVLELHRTRSSWAWVEPEGSQEVGNGRWVWWRPVKSGYPPQPKTAVNVVVHLTVKCKLVRIALLCLLIL
jgi:hypothetical protein